MTEYDKALKFIEKYARPFYRFKNAISTLDELVERAAPKKPIRKYTYSGIIVGVCECQQSCPITFNFCPNCGQALDWSDEK